VCVCVYTCTALTFHPNSPTIAGALAHLHVARLPHLKAKIILQRQAESRRVYSRSNAVVGCSHRSCAGDFPAIRALLALTP
jgi:hypothetical protein